MVNIMFSIIGIRWCKTHIVRLLLA